MVSLEIEKPSTWNMARKIGIIAVILLIIGAFLPYVTWEYTIGTETRTESVSYFNYDFFGLWMFFPLLSGLFVALLLYLKGDIHLEQASKRMNIKPFILMIWGFWFFLCYLIDAIRIGDVYFGGGTYTGFGLWMIVIGFLLCALVGFLEWRYPTMAGPAIAMPKRTKAEPAAQPTPETAAPQPAPQEATAAEPAEPTPEPAVAPAAPKPVPVAEPEPAPAAPAAPATTGKMVVITREPASDEEKVLIRWARHINEDGQTFEQCIKCKNYVFISAKDKGKTIEFNCPDCGALFDLEK
jgi:hypothetical protein